MPLDHDAKCDDHAQRLTVLETNHVSDHRDMDAIVAKISEHVGRFADLNAINVGVARDLATIRDAIREINQALHDDVASKESVDRIQKLLWLIGATIITATVGVIVAWMLKGGLTQGKP